MTKKPSVIPDAAPWQELHRDFLTEPFPVKVNDRDPNGALALALKASGLLSKVAGREVFISHRASLPQTVIGAKPGPPCVGCGQAVWVSPSSRQKVQDPHLAIVCDSCIDVLAVLQSA